MESINDVGNQHYVNPERRHQLLDLIGQRRPVSDFEVEFFRKDGSTFWASLHVRPVYDETDELRFMEGIISDVTEKKNRMEALHKENVRLRSNIKERYRFGKIIGKSPVMQEIYELILKAAASNVGVIGNVCLILANNNYTRAAACGTCRVTYCDWLSTSSMEPICGKSSCAFPIEAYGIHGDIHVSSWLEANLSPSSSA